MTKVYNNITHSFINAFNGLRLAISERNMKIHIYIAAITVILAVIVKLSAVEWAVVLLTTAGVFAAETFNTAIENLSDKVCPTYDNTIKIVKDLAAGAVLIMAISAIIVGLLIFIPKIITLITCLYSTLQ